MSSNRSDVLHTEWENLIENLNATGDDRGAPFFRKAVSRLESFWAERVTSQNDEFIGSVALCAGTVIDGLLHHRISHESIRPFTAGGSPFLPKPVRFPRRGPL